MSGRQARQRRRIKALSRLLYQVWRQWAASPQKLPDREKIITEWPGAVKRVANELTATAQTTGQYDLHTEPPHA